MPTGKMKPLDIEQSLRRFWTGNEILCESVLAIKAPGEMGDLIPLLYPIDKIQRVTSADLTRIYMEEKDYKLIDGQLFIPADSPAMGMTYDEYYPPKPEPEGTFMYRVGGRQIAFSEGHFFHDRQIVISYVHSAVWQGPIPADKSALLPRTMQAMDEGNPLNLVFFGDSITTGANSSGAVGAAPYSPIFPEMIYQTMLAKSRGPVHYTNTAVGGMDTIWGIANVRERVNTYAPDLVILGFGMNDATAQMPPEDYLENTLRIMEIIWEDCPNCEFVLVAGFLPNPEALSFIGPHAQYLSELLKLEAPGVAVAPVQEIFEYILTRKRYRDITGNNINHPNDFIARLYAQVILETMGL